MHRYLNVNIQTMNFSEMNSFPLFVTIFFSILSTNLFLSFRFHVLFMHENIIDNFLLISFWIHCWNEKSISIFFFFYGKSQFDALNEIENEHKDVKSCENDTDHPCSFFFVLFLFPFIHFCIIRDNISLIFRRILLKNVYSAWINEFNSHFFPSFQLDDISFQIHKGDKNGILFSVCIKNFVKISRKKEKLL